MSYSRHLYRNGVRGRSITTRPGVGGVTITAHLLCSGCGRRGDLGCRAVMPPDQMDRKFLQHGWALDPHLCPNCRQRAAEETRMGTKPSPTAMKAQAQMFHSLSAHFDPDAGRYAAGWSDQRIATETGLSKDVVAEFRVAGFGEFKEPEEIRQLRADISTIEQLARDSHAQLTEQVAALRGQLAKLVPAS